MKVMRQKSHKTNRHLYPVLQYGARQILVVMTAPRIARFTAKIDRSAGAERCHLWRGAPGPGGYGLVQGSDDYQGYSFLAHRVAWALYNNIEPGQRVIRHSCDTPACCNPRHLIDGTHTDNTRDMNDRGRDNFFGAKGRIGADANAARYTAEQRATAIAMRHIERRKINEIADAIGANRTTIMRWIAEA